MNKNEYVDLGYGLKFATCNLGAEKPEDYGMYFQWGSIEGELITNKQCPYIIWGVHYINKYNNGDFDGTVDNKLVLDASDDAATQMLGSDWRIPTYNELSMLTDTNKFTSEWIQINGVNGRRFTSKENGNSIFIPASGWCNDSSLKNRGEDCSLWSSSLDEDYSGDAWYLRFHSDDWYMTGYSRCNGCSIRPVFIG